MAMAIGLIGGIISGIGSLMAAQAQAAAAQHNADVAAVNAKTARLQAGADAKTKRREKQRALGAVRATGAANGVDMTGSALDIAADNFLEYELAERNIVYGGEVQNADFKNKEAGYLLEKKSAGIQGLVGFASGVIGGVGNALRLA
jgi:hypothetical protein